MIKNCYYTIYLWLFAANGISVAAAAEIQNTWDLNLDLYVGTDGNINRSAFNEYELDDTSAGIELSLKKHHSLSFNKEFVYSFKLVNESYSEWSKLNHSSAGVGIEYRFRSRTGYTAPIVSLYSEFRSADYSSHLRSGTELVLGISWFKRVTDRVSIVLGLEGVRRDSDSNVFDIDRNRLYGMFDWSLSNPISLYLQYHFLNGDIVSSVPANSYNYGNTVPYQLDDAFHFIDVDTTQNPPGSGSPYGGASTTNVNLIPAYAYQLDAETTVWEIGCNIPITHTQALQIALANYDSEANNEVNYAGSSSRIDYLIRF